VPDHATAARGLPAALALSCHPGPALAVTVVATLLAVAAGAPAATVALVAAAFAAGQLSIGWSNDWLDAARDVAVGRSDKPVATGAVSSGSVRRAAVVAAVLAVPLSLALGVPAAVAHLVGVASGWTYNLGLKSTAWSWAPYAVTFGLLPAVVTLALPGAPLPPAWAIAAGALLGIGAHLVNVLPDLEDDAATGVRGLPHRLGRRTSSLLAPAVLTVASLLVVLGPAGAPGPWDWAALAAVAVLASVAAGSATTSGRRRLPLLATVLVAAVDVVLLLAHGSALTG
jgi:4-hydroxybenzoate polyprenyltransferase